MGQVHRNTFLEAPRVLSHDLSARERPHLFFAGQLTGVEGYVESAACGLLAARSIRDWLAGRPFCAPPPATALGALHRHLTGAAHPPDYPYQPSNVVFALFPPLEGRFRGKAARKEAYAEAGAQGADTVDRHRLGTLGVHLLLTATALSACTSSNETTSLGERRAPGAVRWVAATADGAYLAWLDGCVEARAQSLPAGTANCDLHVIPAAGGESTLLARAVSTLPGAVEVDPQGAEISALAGYDYASACGTLVRWRATSGARELARVVTFHGYGSDGALGYLAGGELFLAPAGANPEKVPGASQGASFELGPRGSELLALLRRKASAGGELLSVSRAGAALSSSPVLPGARVGDYGFARAQQFAFTRLAKDGDELLLAEARAGAKPALVGKGVRAFAFAPKGDAVAYLSQAAPGKQGNLSLRSGGHEEVLGREVGEMRWAARADRLAWLEEHDPRVRSGTLGVGGTDLPRRTLGKNVSDLELSADGRYVAFLEHSTRGGYTVDLLLAVLDEAGTAPRRVAQGSFGFAFSPDGRWLYYRTGCTRTGEACDLERIDPRAPSGEPERIADGVKSFEFDLDDPGRLLLGWKRVDRDALDIGVFRDGKVTRVDSNVLPGSARFLRPDGRRVAYAVVEEKRLGVYLAPVP